MGGIAHHHRQIAEAEAQIALCLLNIEQGLGAGGPGLQHISTGRQANPALLLSRLEDGFSRGQ